jgi:hypothetical protein
MPDADDGEGCCLVAVGAAVGVVDWVVGQDEGGAGGKGPDGALAGVGFVARFEGFDLATGSARGRTDR